MKVKLNFITASGKTYNYATDDSATILQVKNDIAQKENLDASNLLLLISKTLLQDNDVIKDLNIVPGTCIMIHQTNQFINRKLPSNEELVSNEKTTPKLNVQPGDPPDFEILVSRLLEFGYDQEKCESALRRAKYDLNEAAIIVISDP